MFFCDGTFKYAPSFFLQMYTFFVIINGYYIPVAFFLLNNKKCSTYKKMIKMLMDESSKLGYTLKFDIITVDFERAMHKAIKEITPLSIIRGCRFHLGQSWFRKIQSLGLSSISKDSNNLQGRWLIQINF